jgi:hypothetical protein
LTIRSCWPLALPDFTLTEPSSADVELAEGSGRDFSAARAETAEGVNEAAWSQTFTLKEGSTYLRWANLFEFLISRDGRRIVGRPLGDASWEGFQTYLLGQVLSHALINQGLEPVHATVVATGAGALALLGDCGYGKSSLAAAFLRAGARLLTDDLLLLEEKNGGFLAYPSFPRLKLFPETIRSILGREADGSFMNPYTRKLVIPVDPHQFCATPQPLRALLVLRPPRPEAPPRRLTIRKLTPRQAHLALHANTFNAAVTDPARLQRLFRLAARVAAVVPAKSLSYPRDLGRLPEIVEAVLANLGRIPPRRG